ncbi:MAG: thioredoxin domain-containing protein [Candidatus Kaiserbacteria bacterium]|nr:thioredoxin domain-containing protein [Candidatus Kaiserbacteria bacterium]MCB9816212.1 thioredoxin domain-containing protein [Candidatus Nomurabacteria bacterium]
MEPSTDQTSPAVPIAIICGFAMIAIAIFFTNKNDQAPVTNQQTAERQAGVGEARPVDKTDYIFGNPNAPILMVEYSDYDCPFCKQYHYTMGQIMDEYGVTGQVAWVYRQFPLGDLHPNSPKISEAALCVGDLGGNAAFWKFSDLVFEERDIDAPTNVTKLPEYAEAAGVDRTKYIECVQSGRMEEKVLQSIEDGYNSGARGTPYTVLIAGNQQAVISGAQPYDTLKGVVQNLIDQLEGTFDPSTAQQSGEVPTTANGVPILE